MGWDLDNASLTCRKFAFCWRKKINHDGHCSVLSWKTNASLLTELARAMESWLSAVLDDLGCLAQIILIAGTRNVIRIKKQGCKRIRIEKQGCKWAFTIIYEISPLPYNTNNRWLCRPRLLSFFRIARECGRWIYVVLFASIFLQSEFALQILLQAAIAEIISLFLWRSSFRAVMPSWYLR